LCVNHQLFRTLELADFSETVMNDYEWVSDFCVQGGPKSKVMHFCHLMMLNSFMSIAYNAIIVNIYIIFAVLCYC